MADRKRLSAGLCCVAVTPPSEHVKTGVLGTVEDVELRPVCRPIARSSMDRSLPQSIDSIPTTHSPSCVTGLCASLPCQSWWCLLGVKGLTVLQEVYVPPSRRCAGFCCVHRTCSEMAAGLRGTSHVTTKQRYKYTTSVDIIYAKCAV